MPMIDWSPIRIGDIVSFSGFAIGGLSVVFLMKSDIRVLGVRLGFLEETVKKETEAQNEKIEKQSNEISRFGDHLNSMGRFEERMLMLRRDVEDLKRGRGYIVSPPVQESG